MKYKSLLLLLVVLTSLSFAIVMIEPIAKELKSGEILELGTIGPGQTIFLTINPKVESGGKFGQGGRYDYALVTQLPPAWKGKSSKLYGDPLQIEITADKNAKEGEYTAGISVQDEGNGELLGNITFTVKVKIVYDIMDMYVSPSSTVVGPGQPARYMITVKNKGTTSDVFTVKAQGVTRWLFEKPVHVPALSSRTITYEISENEGANYRPKITVESTSSPIIKKEKEVQFVVEPNLLNDFKAANHGIFIFPIFEAPAYAIAGLFSNLW